MKENLVIATTNKGKIREMTSLLSGFKIYSLEDIGFNEEIEEPYERFEENAHIKASTVFEFSKKNTMAEDSGLCVAALNNAPGVYSARYAGEPRNDERNNNKLLFELKNVQERHAFYKSVICLIYGNETYFFEGICRGKIAFEPLGNGGFGYDPLFIPDGYDETFAQLRHSVKNTISHRAFAIKKMLEFLH